MVGEIEGEECRCECEHYKHNIASTFFRPTHQIPKKTRGHDPRALDILEKRKGKE